MQLPQATLQNSFKLISYAWLYACLYSTASEMDATELQAILMFIAGTEIVLWVHSLMNAGQPLFKWENHTHNHLQSQNFNDNVDQANVNNGAGIQTNGDRK